MLIDFFWLESLTFSIAETDGEKTLPVVYFRVDLSLGFKREGLVTEALEATELPNLGSLYLYLCLVLQNTDLIKSPETKEQSRYLATLSGSSEG